MRKYLSVTVWGNSECSDTRDWFFEFTKEVVDVQGIWPKGAMDNVHFLKICRSIYCSNVLNVIIWKRSFSKDTVGINCNNLYFVISIHSKWNYKMLWIRWEFHCLVIKVLIKRLKSLKLLFCFWIVNRHKFLSCNGKSLTVPSWLSVINRRLFKLDIFFILFPINYSNVTIFVENNKVLIVFREECFLSFKFSSNKVQKIKV